MSNDPLTPTTAKPGSYRLIFSQNASTSSLATVSTAGLEVVDDAAVVSRPFAARLVVVAAFETVSYVPRLNSSLTTTGCQ